MDYSGSSRMLHKLVLGNNFLMRSLFNLEVDKYGRDEEGQIGKRHVFVSGLARAGTTALMRTLYETGAFSSLTYRDMPFVIAPNFWRSIRGGKKAASEMKERAHGDGLFVNEDSPEALDEVFWKLFCGREYILPNILRPHDAGPETISRFRQYVAAIIRGSGATDSLYLSKNNNTILRLPAIREAFPEAVIITPYRKPLDHALSLLHQHQRFSIQITDRFTAQYMQWLGHHEFGAGHRPFDLPHADAYSLEGGDPMSAGYWLKVWYNYYRYALDIFHKQVHFLGYEEFCREPGACMQRLSQHIGISIDTQNLHSYTPPARHADSIDENLLGKCGELYSELEHASARF